MKVTALRGVCIGIDQHLKAGDIADLDPATGKYLVSIGAVKEFDEATMQPAIQPESSMDSQQTDTDSESESKSKSKSKK